MTALRHWPTALIILSSFALAASLGEGWRSTRALALASSSPAALTAPTGLRQAALSELSGSLGFNGYWRELEKALLSDTPAQLLPTLESKLDAADSALLQLSGLPNQTGDAAARRDIEEALASLRRLNQTLANNRLSTTDMRLAAQAALSSIQNAAQQLRQNAAQNTQQEWQAQLYRLTALLLGAAASLVVLLLTIAVLWRRQWLKPMDELAMAAQILAKGDLRATLPHRERADAVGALARAMDHARAHLANQPDLLIENGEQQLAVRFDNTARSSFDALTRELASTSAQLRDVQQSISSITQNTEQQLADMLSTTRTLTGQIGTEAAATQEQLVQAGAALKEAGQALTQTHNLVRDEVGSFMPELKKRVESVTELASLTGREVGQALQSLMASEKQFKQAATRSDTVVTHFANTAQELPETLQAATNILRAAGKVMHDNAESLRVDLTRAVATVDSANNSLTSTLEETAPRLANMVEQAENVLASSENAANGLLAAITSVQNNGELLASQVGTTNARLNEFGSSLAQAQQSFVGAAQLLSEQGGAVVHMLESITHTKDRLSDQLTAQTAKAQVLLERMAQGGDQVLQEAQKLNAQTTELARQHQQAMQNESISLAEREDHIEQLSSATQTLADKTTKAAAEIAQIHALLIQFEALAPRLAALAAIPMPAELPSESAITSLKDKIGDSINAQDVTSVRIMATMQGIRDQLMQQLADTTSEAERTAMLLADRAHELSAKLNDLPSFAALPDPTPALQELQDKIAQLTQKIEQQKIEQQKTGPTATIQSRNNIPTGSNAENATLSSTARSVLQKLRGSSESKEASTRNSIEHLQLLVQKLAQQTAQMAAQHQTADAQEIGREAGTLIAAVMESIAQLNNVAENITELADKVSA